MRISFAQCLQQALISKDFKVEHYLKSTLSSKNLMSLYDVNFANGWLQRMECGVTNGGLWANFTIFLLVNSIHQTSFGNVVNKNMQTIHECGDKI